MDPVENDFVTPPAASHVTSEAGTDIQPVAAVAQSASFNQNNPLNMLAGESGNEQCALEGLDSCPPLGQDCDDSCPPLGQDCDNPELSVDYPELAGESLKSNLDISWGLEWEGELMCPEQDEFLEPPPHPDDYDVDDAGMLGCLISEKSDTFNAINDGVIAYAANIPSNSDVRIATTMADTPYVLGSEVDMLVEPENITEATGAGDDTGDDLNDVIKDVLLKAKKERNNRVLVSMSSSLISQSQRLDAVEKDLEVKTKMVRMLEGRVKDRDTYIKQLEEENEKLRYFSRNSLDDFQDKYVLALHELEREKVSLQDKVTVLTSKLACRAESQDREASMIMSALYEMGVRTMNANIESQLAEMNKMNNTLEAKESKERERSESPVKYKEYFGENSSEFSMEEV